MADFPGDIFLGNSFNVRLGSAEAPLQVEHPTTGVVGAYSGQTIRCYIALNTTASGEDRPADDPVDASLTVAAMVEDGLVPGFYRAGFNGDSLSAHLSAHVDEKVWVVYTSDDGTYERAEYVMVRDLRSGV